jgi:hypothetical protein
VNDQNGRYARVRYTATGAVAALAVAGAIAGGAALAANTHANTHRHVLAATAAAKMAQRSHALTAVCPSKNPPPQPAVNQQPFLAAVQRLVNDGTITNAQGQAVDRGIRADGIDPNTLAGFTQAQRQAVQQALGNAKRALVRNMHPQGSSKP